MPVWASFTLFKLVLPQVISWLQHEGYLNAAEGLAAKSYVEIKQDLKDIKTYPEYPKGRNGV